MTARSRGRRRTRSSRWTGTYNYGYTYDPADNPTKITRPAGSASLVPNALNQVTTYNGVRLSYDANGNLLRDATATYAWDAENRLVGITYANGSSSSFAYDGLGRRTAIGSTSGGVTTATHYGWCGAMLCQARDGQDNPVRRYLAEGEDTPAQNMHLYYAVDQLGSVRDALDASTGASVAHYDYEPYGAPLGRPKASATDFRFAGLFYHQPSGLYLANARAMDPTDGRWESRDPLGETAGFNLYGYAEANPTNYVDDSGLATYYVEGGYSLFAIIGFQHNVGIFYTGKNSFGVPDIGVFSSKGPGAGLSAGFGAQVGYDARNLSGFQGTSSSFDAAAGIYGGSIQMTQPGQVVGGTLGLVTPGYGISVSTTNTSTFSLGEDIVAPIINGILSAFGVGGKSNGCGK